MDPITLLLLSGSAYFLLNKKSKSNKISKPVSKEIKGFEINKTCNNIIIYDIKKAKQWLLNSIIKEKLSADEISKIIFESCKLDDINPTNKNYHFLYDTYGYVVSYFMNKNLSFDEFLKFYVALTTQYTILTSVLKQEDINTENFKLPILLLNDKVKTELISRRSYIIDDCIIEIEDYLKMGVFARKVSKFIPFLDNIDLAYEIFHNVIFDQCEEINDLSHKDEYNLAKEFFNGQLDNGVISLAEANMSLNEWIEEYENEGLDTEDLTPLSGNI